MLVLYLLLLCASTLAYVRPPPTLYDLEDAENIFEEFIKKYNKVYANEQEKQERFTLFKEKLEMVNKLRSSESGQQASFDINDFADWTEIEFQSRFLRYKPDPNPITPEVINVTMDLPDRWDWREHNVVTEVKNQGKICGSCWAFGTIGTVEGAYALKHKKLLSFSEQQLVDCDKIDNGCEGGTERSALRYLISAGGLELESDYPYEARDAKCRFNASKVKARVVGQKAIYFTDDDNPTKQALIQYGPISIGVATDWDWVFYKGGIFNCPTGPIGHAVLLVGYGTENGVPYWTIKESAGPMWGEHGYIRVRRGNNPCSMNNDQGTVAFVA